MSYRACYAVHTDTNLVDEFDTRKERDEWVSDNPELRKGLRNEPIVLSYVRKNRRVGYMHD